MENSTDNSTVDESHLVTNDGSSRLLATKDYSTNHTVVSKPDCLYGPQVIDVIMRKPEFSLLIRYYNLLYQSLIPNCKLTIKILKQHIEIPSDVEKFIVNGESSRIRCQRIINLLLVQLDTTRDYKHFCYLFNMISVMPNLTDKLRTDTTRNIHPLILNMPNSVNQLDTHAVDNIIIRCVDGGPSDDRTDNYSISSRHQVIGRRCRTVTTTTTDKNIATTMMTTTTISSEVTSNGHHLHTNSTPVSTDVTFSVTESIITPASPGTEIGDAHQVSAYDLMRSKYDDIVQSLPSDYEKTLQVVQDQLTDDQICDVLSSSNYTIANKTILNCLMEKVKCTADISEFCDQLDKIISLLPDPGVLSSVVGELRQASLPKQGVDKERILPMKLTAKSDFAPLKIHYHTILQLMPDNYEQSIGKLQNYISDDQICMILSSSNTTTANKILLDCLIERMSCTEELLDLYDQLQTISTSHQLNMLISEIRSELLSADYSTPPTTTTTTTALPNDGISSSSDYPNTLQQTSNDSPARIGVASVPQSNQGVSTNMELQVQLKHKHRRLEKGIKCPPPPPITPNYVCRELLLDEMVTKLCQSTIDPHSYETSLTVTGAGGFGKTSIVTALCHHPVIKEQFKDGVVFIELGPQATDPSMKLKGLHNLLTDEQCDVNVIEQQINQLTSLYCRNLLVIIDDVWHVEDAEPIVKAFSNCKIVLTTRMNDIDQYIPTKQVVSVGPMEQSEAISLLTSGVIDISQLSQEDVNSLDELAQDVHLWPLLLSLIRGQLSHNLKRRSLLPHEGIQSVKTKLYDKGLTGFDRNNIEKSRKYAVKVCIDVTLELLTKSLSDKIKSLILWTGIGTSLPTKVLHNLWNVTEQEASDNIDILWVYGLVQFSDTIIPPHNNKQHCVEAHAVISHYIFDCMDSNEVQTLSPITGLGTSTSILLGIKQQFQSSCGVHNLASLTVVDYLKYKLSEIENLLLPSYLKRVNLCTINDPHIVILTLERLQNALKISTKIKKFLPSLCEKINSLISECHKTLKDVHRLSRELNQNVQHCLTHKNYDNLIQTMQAFIINYPIGLVAQQAIMLIKKVIPLCSGKLLHFVTEKCEQLHMMTPEYHHITLMYLPHIQIFTKCFQQINNSLKAGPPLINTMYHYYKGKKYDEELDLSETNRLIKLQEVAPNWVHEILSESCS
ncbi:uncharacterized protein [Dysidea avara]|uniref:uncharacterized protein isoform X2 n=1 Tax=Dysidea avara TaxID=196820 RepID=UPI003329BA39